MDGIDWLSIIRKSELFDKKKKFLPNSDCINTIYGFTPWTLTKLKEKKLDSRSTRMLRGILIKSWKQHLRKLQLYSHLTPISKTIQARRKRDVGHCWRNNEELKSDVMLWSPSYGLAGAGRPINIFPTAAL